MADIVNFFYRLEYDWANTWIAVRRFFADAWNAVVDKLAAGAIAILNIIGKIAVAFGKEDVTAPLIAQIEGFAARAKVALDDIQPPTLKTFAWAEEAEEAVQGLTQGMGNLREAEAAAAAEAQNTASALLTVDGSAKKTKQSVSDLVAALVRVHPASIAAAQAVAGWQAQIDGVNAALQANQRRQRDMQAKIAQTRRASAGSTSS